MSVFFYNIPFRIHSFSYVKFYSKYSKQKLLKILGDMPKEPKHIAETQKQRRKLKEKLAKYVPGKVMLQVLGTGAKGTPRALYMFSDQSRYLFNCGEGTQRLAHEHKMKLAKLEHVFITQPVWKNIGGLPGTALTIQDVGVPEITLHGPKGLDEMFVATKRFVVIKDLKIHMAQCDVDTVFEDNVMSVRYVPIYKQKYNESSLIGNSSQNSSNKNDSEVEAIVEQSDASTSTRTKRRSRNLSGEDDQDDIDYYAYEHKNQAIAPSITSNNNYKMLEELKDKGAAMNFICKLLPRPGALNLTKCVEKGVPPGPLLGKLKNGEDIVLKNGVTVLSKDVCEPDDPGPLFIVVDCPSCEYIESFIDNPAFKKHQKFCKNEEDFAYLVIHFSPREVVLDSRYKQWMDDFSASTQHLMINELNTCMGSQAVHRAQHKLNMLSENIFPLLGDKGTEIVTEDLDIHVNKKQKCDNASDNGVVNGAIPDMETLSVQSRPQSPLQPFVIANTFCNFHLRPMSGLDRCQELKLNPKQYINETMVLENFTNILKQLKCDINEKRKTIATEKYPQILFLGTGSCIPNKTRNTSGILVKLSESQYMLLDCGEGTYGQLVRFFGDAVDQEISKINAIYVSHLHADHHIGLIGVLQGRRRALNATNITKGPIHLFAPKQIMTWLNFYDRCFEDIAEEFRLTSNSDFLSNRPVSMQTSEEMLNYVGLSSIETCYVRHCPNAFGVSIKTKNGIKLTYSGDTMPCDSLVDLGKDSHILIHEATMEDELAHEAIIKMHSTTSQAIEIGKKMNAKNILLTHFSQRYAKLPRFNENFSDNVGIAFDNMQVGVNDLPLLPLFYPALKLMFAEYYEELEHKAVKRQLKLQREKSFSENRERQKQESGS